MRLIDADALEVALHNFFDGKVIDEPTYILRDVFCHIDGAPTIIKCGITSEGLPLMDLTPKDMEFAKWVTKMIFDNGVEDFDFELFSELACRKLEKLGLVEKTENEWRMKGGAE